MIVKVISKSTVSALIEWSDEEGLHRGTVPLGLVFGNIVDDNHLSMAIPYGVDWEFELSDFIRSVDASDLAKSLHAHGIWTADDARSNPQTVQGAILSAYGVTLAAVFQVARTKFKHGGS